MLVFVIIWSACFFVSMLAVGFQGIWDHDHSVIRLAFLGAFGWLSTLIVSIIWASKGKK